MRKKHPIGFYTYAVIFLFAIASISHWIERYQSEFLLIAFFTAFISYLLILQEKHSFWHLFVIGLLGRIVLFFSLPSLSDDLFRFIWDGTLIKNGIHPFAELPSYYLNQPVNGLDQGLYNQLNSPNYFTIYPPLNQAIFWLSVQFGDSWLVSANIIRVFLIVAEVTSFFLLRSLLSHFQKNEHLAFWYFLNPLVILEITGNLHFEGLVVLFLLIGILGFEKSKNWISIGGFGLAIGAKLLPVIYLPYLFFSGLKNKRWWVAIAAGVVGLITLLPLFNQAFINGMSSSLDLYFRKFEFNASLYFIAREIGYWVYGYNNIAKIGPLLSVFSFLAIMSLSVYAGLKKWKAPKTFLFISCIYLMFSTIIHPWYILPLIAFGLLSGYWFPIFWSFMIFLTYMGYTKTGFELPMWIVVLEYMTIISVFIFETQTIKKKYKDYL